MHCIGDKCPIYYESDNRGSCEYCNFCYEFMDGCPISEIVMQAYEHLDILNAIGNKVYAEQTR